MGIGKAGALSNGSLIVEMGDTNTWGSSTGWLVSPATNTNGLILTNAYLLGLDASAKGELRASNVSNDGTIVIAVGTGLMTAAVMGAVKVPAGKGLHLNVTSGSVNGQVTYTLL